MKIKRGMKIAAAASILVLAGATPALATVTHVSGGTWDYGAGSSIVWSDYYHKDKCHSSTAVGEYIDSDEAAAGSWSYAQADVALSGNESYYSTSC